MNGPKNFSFHDEVMDCAERRTVVAAAPSDDLIALGETSHRLYLLGELQGTFDRFRTAGAGSAG
jgi:hypothetical protein